MKGCRREPGIGTLILPALIILTTVLSPAGQTSAQQRSGARASRTREDPNLPAQRAPLPRSELDLGAIPFRIVYESFRETEGRENWEICRIDADGSNNVVLTNTPDVDEFYPHASPDGTRISFVADEGESPETRRRNVYVMGIDGSGRTRVAENARQPCWSPDGRYIAYMKGEFARYRGDSWSNRGLDFYEVATGQVHSHPNDGLRLLFNICWSPDGRWFVATSRGGGRDNIAFQADNTTEIALSIHGCRPDISPDGGRIAWGRSDWDIAVGAIDFSAGTENVRDQRPVIACTRDFKVYHVDWSPDANYLAFSYGPSRGNQAVGRKAPGWNICIYDLRSGKWTEITDDGQHNKEPDWVPIPSAGR